MSTGANPKTANWEKLKRNLRDFRVSSCIGVHPRYEIGDFAKKQTQFNLFLLALEKLQSPVTADTDLRIANLARDWLSYFHLSGIHGCPPIDWADVPQDAYFYWLQNARGLKGEWVPSSVASEMDWGNRKNRLGNPQGGYCTHGTPLFLIWHRPYLALIEQVIVITAKEIADTYTDVNERADALKEAEKLRFPYWNSFRPSSGSYSESNLRFDLPRPLSAKYVRIRRPNTNTYVHILNPLYQYTLPPETTIKAAFPGNEPQTSDKPSDRPDNDFTCWTILINAMRTPIPNVALNPNIKTVRHPNNEVSSHPDMNRVLNQDVALQRQKIFNVFSNSAADFSEVSCARVIVSGAVNPTVVNVLSFEAIHDKHHKLLGGEGGPLLNGSMTIQNVSAFDPVFFCLHSYYELQLCTWQTINYDKYWPSTLGIGRGINRGGTRNCAWLRSTAVERGTTPLMPFKMPLERRAGLFRTELNYWDAENARDWTQFGYTYENLPSEFPTTTAVKEQYKKVASEMVTTIYGWKMPGVENRTAELERILPVVRYDTLPWYPRLLAGSVLSDATDVNDLDPHADQPAASAGGGGGSGVPVVPVAPVGGGGGSGVPAVPVVPIGGGSGSGMTIMPVMTVGGDDGSGVGVHGGAGESGALKSQPSPRRALPRSIRRTEGGANADIADFIAHVPVGVFSTPAIHSEQQGVVSDPNAVSRLATGDGVASDHTNIGSDQQDSIPAPTNGQPARSLPTSKGPAETPRATDGRPEYPGFLLRDGKPRFWDFSFQVKRFAFNGPFTVEVFIGDFNPNPSAWASDPSRVGNSVILVSVSLDSDPYNVPCANCVVQMEDEAMYGDYVPLTLKLIDYVKSGEKQPPGDDGLVLRSLDPVDVVPFLTRNLHWRVKDLSGTEFGREDTPGLLACVSSYTMTLSGDATELPVRGERENFLDITHGRPSGQNHPDIAGVPGNGG